MAKEIKMSPVIRISDSTFVDLKVIATWLGIKTPPETLDHLVHEAMERLGIERDDEPEPITTAAATSDRVIEFNTAPGLAFTIPITASIDGKMLRNPTWSEILLAMIGQVKDKGYKGQNLVNELDIPARADRYEKEGFTFRPVLGISVQGKSTPDCWKEIDRIAKKWHIPVSVEFRWRQNPKAQYPGKMGVLRSGVKNISPDTEPKIGGGSELDSIADAFDLYVETKGLRAILNAYAKQGRVLMQEATGTVKYLSDLRKFCGTKGTVYVSMIRKFSRIHRKAAAIFVHEQTGRSDDQMDGTLSHYGRWLNFTLLGIVVDY